TTADGLAEGTVTCLSVVGELGILAGIGTNGAMFIDGRTFKTVTSQIRVSDMVRSQDGFYWVPFLQNDQRAIAISDNSNPIAIVTNFSTLPEGRITCMDSASDGSVWAGCAGGGVIRFDSRSRTPNLVVTNGLLTNFVNAIHCTSQGAVW